MLISKNKLSNHASSKASLLPHKSLTIFIVTLLVSSLSACGNSEDETESLETTSFSTQGILCDYDYYAFNESPSVNYYSESSWTCSDGTRNLVSNGIPDHETGTFPNAGNPNLIGVQDIAVSYTLSPIESTPTELGGPAGAIAYVLNGVKVDPGTGGTCDDSGTICDLGAMVGNWRIEALGHNSFDFGTDDNNAHVQPNGEYHYHGMPEGFIALRGGSDQQMTLIAWAADGFPIYARYGYSEANNANSALKSMTGSYQFVTAISDSRPPVSTYQMGTFVQDWEYVEGSGDLDECNGRFGVTPEFPEGIYHYYATDSYPFFQRCVKGEVTSAGGPP